MNSILPVLKKILFIENHKMAKKGTKMVALQAEITEILYYYDPVGLAAAECPEDEYEPEAISILHALRNVKDLTELRWMVYDVFVSWFCEITILPRSDKCYRYIAEDILESWQKVIEESEAEGKNNVR